MPLHFLSTVWLFFHPWITFDICFLKNKLKATKTLLGSKGRGWVLLLNKHILHQKCFCPYNYPFVNFFTTLFRESTLTKRKSACWGNDAITLHFVFREPLFSKMLTLHQSVWTHSSCLHRWLVWITQFIHEDQSRKGEMAHTGHTDSW